ncbi:MAG: YbhN family protein [Rhodoblastus sp.]
MREDDATAEKAPTPNGESETSGERTWSERRAIVAARKRLFDRKHLGRTIGAVLSIGIFILSIFVLARVVAELDIAALRAAIAATSAEQIAAACLLACVSYLALTGYDALALRQIGAHVRYRVTALGSFTSYAISFTLGFPLITGGAVRYWIYSRAGLSAGKVASLTVVAGVTFWLGMAFVAGVSLLLRAEAISWIDNLPARVNAAIGAGVLIAIAAYVAWVAMAPRRVRVQGFRLRLPGPLVTLGQMTLGVIDLCAAAGVLYVLLAGQDPDRFPEFRGDLRARLHSRHRQPCAGRHRRVRGDHAALRAGAEHVFAVRLAAAVSHHLLSRALRLRAGAARRGRRPAALEGAAQGDGIRAGRRGLISPQGIPSMSTRG